MFENRVTEYQFEPIGYIACLILSGLTATRMQEWIDVNVCPFSILRSTLGIIWKYEITRNRTIRRTREYQIIVHLVFHLIL